MKLDQLRRMALFAMVAQEGSFTAVSKLQNIATSAISSAVTQLEDEIGTRLFHRTTRKLRLSAAGEVFLKRCQAMLFEANTAHEELNLLTGQLVGALTITASLWEAEAWVLPALQPLLQDNPRLTLNLLVQDEQLDLIEHGIDIAIRSGQLADSSLIARALVELPEVIVASPMYLSKNGTPKNADDLSEQRIIAFTPFMQPQQLSLIDGAGKVQIVQLKLGAQANNTQLVKKLCIMGMGVARLPLAMVKDALDDGTLIKILPKYTLPIIKIYAITTRRDMQPAKVIAALTALQTHIQKNPS
jgi:DNA-binding transcriptional LysR family regulator